MKYRKKIESKIVPAAKKYHDYLVNPSDSLFFIHRTTENKVEKFIETLKTTKLIALQVNLANSLSSSKTI